MRLRTTQKFKATPGQLWPLLFSSKMDNKRPCYFLCGLPKPLECRLKEEGGPGKIRECVSDKGIISQEILEWQPNEKLSFELRETDIYFGPCVDSIVESFEIKPLDRQTTAITRTTVFQLRSSVKYFLAVPMYVGLKAIHRYVFKNWRRLSKS